MKVVSKSVVSNKKDKIIPKVTLKLVLPCGEAKNNAYIGPLLGQHQINITSFCNEFNKKSSLKYAIGALLPVEVILNKDKTYTMNIRFPLLSFYLDQASETDIFNNKLISIEKLYDIVKIFSLFFELDLESTAFLVFGFLSSIDEKYIIIIK